MYLSNVLNNLNEYILLGKGEESHGRNSDSLISDCFEAFVAALYLDLGYMKAQNFALSLFKKYIDTVGIDSILKKLKDPKTMLQEYVASDSKRTVTYKVVDQVGPSNHPIFTVEVYNDLFLLGRGKGTNKLMAEENAAKDALEKMVK